MALPPSSVGFLLSVMSLGVVFGSPVETELLNALLKGYDKAIRPVLNVTDTLDLSIDLMLNQLIAVEEKAQVIKLNIWMRWHWTDHNLQWNPSDYGGIDEIYVLPSEIWIPDIRLYNSVSAEDKGWPSHYNVKIGQDGSASFLFPTFLEAMCKMDMTYFPFDTQKCTLKFGSWGYNGQALDIHPVDDHGDMRAFVGSVEWDLVEISATRDLAFYTCCPEPYPDVKYTVTLRRLPLPYFSSLLLPCFIITLMNLSTFLLRVESGQKITLNIAMLLALVFFLMSVADVMPPQSEVIPVIGKYLSTCIALLSFTTLITVFVIHLNFRGSRGRPVPAFLKRYLFNWLGNLLLYGDTLRFTRFGDVIKVNQADAFTITLKVGERKRNICSRADTDTDISSLYRAEQEWITVALLVDRLSFVLMALGTVVITAYVAYSV